MVIALRERHGAPRITDETPRTHYHRTLLHSHLRPRKVSALPLADGSYRLVDRVVLVVGVGEAALDWPPPISMEGVGEAALDWLSLMSLGRAGRPSLGRWL